MCLCSLGMTVIPLSLTLWTTVEILGHWFSLQQYTHSFYTLLSALYSVDTLKQNAHLFRQAFG